jgi:hypothetical protein
MYSRQYVWQQITWTHVMRVTCSRQRPSQQQKQRPMMPQQQHWIHSLVTQLLSSSHSFQASQGPGHLFWVDYSRQLAAVQGGTACTVSRPIGHCQLGTWLVLMMNLRALQRQQYQQEVVVMIAAALVHLCLLLAPRLLPGMPRSLLVLRCV